jgi:Tol biopolymer transport system component
VLANRGDRGYAGRVSKRLRLVLAIALAAIAALALGASPASAAPKEIAYVCHGEDICLLDPDNPSDVFNLTDNGTTSYDEDPVWSPDGKRVAFVARFTSQFPPQTNIYSMEPEAPGQTFNGALQITHFTNGNVPTGDLAWSPDGTKIAFVRGVASAGNQPLWVVRADGSSANATEIPTTGGAGHPTFSADSGKIAFSHNNQVYTLNSDISSPATPLPGATGNEPAWSPDGSKIAYGRESKDINIIGASGGTPLTIASLSQFAFASWSPSGAQLAYHEQAGENSYFRVVNADGSGNHGLPIVQGLNANGPAPSWSPDGSRLVFQGFYFGEADNTNKVYIGNADGSGSVTSLTPDQGFDTEPAWRPNPVAHPGPPVITPSGGSTGPLQGPTIKPKLKWFTNRIPWNEAPYVPMMNVFCGAPTCNSGATGTTKGAIAAGVRSHKLPAAAIAEAKPKASKKKPIVVARGKVFVPSNQERTLKLKLTKLAIKILKKTGKLKMSVTVTTTIAGQPPFKETRSVEIFVKNKKKKR